MLQCRNTLDCNTRLSLAQIIFGRPIKYFIPIMRSSHTHQNTYTEILWAREETMRAKNVKKLNEQGTIAAF